jgi:undecaprenyl-diphosphatase
MDIPQVLILSAVEGITEFLPISSTAHLILTSHVLAIPSSEFLSTFEISIQLGAIGAVCTVYGNKIFQDKKILGKALVGFIPTGILGLTLYKGIKGLLADPIVPVIALFVGGIAIIGIEQFFKSQNKDKKITTKDLSKMTYKDSLLIGLMQSVSMIPGVSRSAASIFGGMALKFDRQAAVDFSFMLAIPTMALATGYELLKTGFNYSSYELLLLLIGIIASYITALLAIKWLLRYIKNNNFIWFGVYRIVLSILYYFIFLR